MKPGAKSKQERGNWLGASEQTREGRGCPSFFPRFFPLQCRSLFSSAKSHLGLVVDRQHNLIDASVLEGLFWGSD